MGGEVTRSQAPVDVVLVSQQRAARQGRPWLMPSLGLMYLSASLRRAGYSVRHFFFFQAEDGIRVDLVTGVQTCALPISSVCPAASNTAVMVQVTVFAGQTLAALPTITPLPSDTEPAAATVPPPTETESPVPTATTVPSDTATPLPTATNTEVPPTATPTFTSTATPSNTYTPTATPTFTPSNTSTPTITPTFTPSPTPTPVPVLNRVINFVTTPVGTLCAGSLIILLMIALMILSGGRSRNARTRPTPPPRK